MQPNRFRDSLIWLLLSVLLLWWRGHTFGPTVLEATGLKLWPVVSGRSEPLDCDEAAYGYMGRRQAEGAALYKDLTEYKPPGGYWFYALAMATGGANEMTVRLMVIPVLIANLWLIGTILQRLNGQAAAICGMIVFILLSTDPYVYGNGSNMEHLMNLGLTFSIYAVMRSSNILNKNKYAWLIAAGAGVGIAATVKQVCLLGLLPIGLYLLMQKETLNHRIRSIMTTGFGFALPWVVAIAILSAQGALNDASTDVIEYSRALAAGTPPDANAPPGFYRWLTGNADPRNGRLPWPFGRTDWLVWWGTGGWPVYLLGFILTPLVFISAKRIENRAESMLAATSWLVAWAMIILPGLYWQHYYMLLGPATSTLVGLAFGRCIERQAGALKFNKIIAACVLAIGIGATLLIQVKSYLMVTAEQLTSKYKGGAQWVSLRLLSEEIGKRVEGWSPRPRLEMWGWQSPLLFYADLDAPSAYFFTDPLMKAFALKGHPMVAPRLERLTRDLQANPPELIFCGDIPFPALKGMIDRDYLASTLVPSAPDGRGFFVRKDLYQRFHDPAFSAVKSR